MAGLGAASGGINSLAQIGAGVEAVWKSSKRSRGGF